MKLYVLDLGKIVMKGANPVLDEPDAEAAIPIHAFLLDTPEGCILFDAGCHPKAMEGAWPPELCGNPYVTGPGENQLPKRPTESSKRSSAFSGVSVNLPRIENVRRKFACIGSSSGKRSFRETPLA